MILDERREWAVGIRARARARSRGLCLAHSSCPTCSFSFPILVLKERWISFRPRWLSWMISLAQPERGRSLEKQT